MVVKWRIWQGGNENVQSALQGFSDGSTRLRRSDDAKMPKDDLSAWALLVVADFHFW